MRRIILSCLSLPFLAFALSIHAADELPSADKAKTVEVFRVPSYCEGVVFDHAGNGYISWDKSITMWLAAFNGSCSVTRICRTSSRFSAWMS